MFSTAATAQQPTQKDLLLDSSFSTWGEIGAQLRAEIEALDGEFLTVYQWANHVYQPLYGWGPDVAAKITQRFGKTQLGASLYGYSDGKGISCREIIMVVHEKADDMWKVRPRIQSLLDQQNRVKVVLVGATADVVNDFRKIATDDPAYAVHEYHAGVLRDVYNAEDDDVMCGRFVS